MLKSQYLFGKNLRFLRKLNEVDLPDLIQKLEIDEKVYMLYEEGECYPEVYTLDKICQLYQISPDLLVDYDLAELIADSGTKKDFQNIVTLLENFPQLSEYAKERLLEKAETLAKKDNS